MRHSTKKRLQCLEEALKDLRKIVTQLECNHPDSIFKTVYLGDICITILIEECRHCGKRLKKYGNERKFIEAQLARLPKKSKRKA